MSAVAKAADALPIAFWDRHDRLHRSLLQTMIADPTAFADVPRDAVLFLLPHDADNAYLDASLTAGRDMLLKGRNVYFRLIAPGELPASDDAATEGSWDDNVVRREHFDPPLDDDETDTPDESIR
jgi:hypothetical protein